MIQTSRAPVVTGEWECTECGYTEEGIETRRPAKCPGCDAPADALEFFADDEDEGDDFEDLETEDLEDDLGDEDEYDEYDDDGFDDDEDDY